MENPRPTDAAERNKINYLKAKEAFNDNLIGQCVRFYAVDHQVRSKPSSQGREVIEGFLRDLHETWPDIQITVEHCVAEDEWVMGRSVATATHSKTVLGVPPTGKKITATFWDLHRFDDNGLIIETWNLMDSLAIMTQIGLLK